ncbi:MAG: GNAT family N-acetyltransferase [Firmicutes bacterium]|nr:GNAT family N-acetyltransferase [Bacillota bacterium]
MNIAPDGNEKLSVRFATEMDIDLIMGQLIFGLADYEGLRHQVTTTKEMMLEELFVKKSATVIVGEKDSRPVALAVYFENFSTFLGKKGMFVEDIWIIPGNEGNGYGKAMLEHLAKIALDKNYGRMETYTIPQNESAIALFDSLGMKDRGLYTYRLTPEQLDHFAKKACSKN